MPESTDKYPDSQPERRWLELSLAQQAVWLDAKMSDPSAYQLGTWSRIGIDLDEAIVRQATSIMMARHDALRLRVDDELPRQWLDESVTPPVFVAELPGDLDPDLAFATYLEEAFAPAMPWGDHSLFQLHLIRTGHGLCFLLWRFHHLIADSISISLVMKFWTATYATLISDTPFELAPSSSYLPVIASDTAYLSSSAYKQDLDYWLARYDPLPSALIESESASPLTDRQTVSADCSIDGDVFAQLERSARTAGVNIQRILFALFTLTISRRYGQSDLVTGIALHRRDQTNRNGLGMFSGVIAVRSTVNPKSSLLTFVRDFNVQVDSDLRHQRMPVDQISRALELFRLGRARLFEATVSYLALDRIQGDPEMDDLPITVGAVPTQEASPLSFHVTDFVHGSGLAIRLGVNTHLHDGAEAAVVLGLFQSVLLQFVTTPNAPAQSLNFSRFVPQVPLDTVTSPETTIEEWSF